MEKGKFAFVRRTLSNSRRELRNILGAFKPKRVTPPSHSSRRDTISNPDDLRNELTDVISPDTFVPTAPVQEATIVVSKPEIMLTQTHKAKREVHYEENSNGGGNGSKEEQPGANITVVLTPLPTDTPRADRTTLGPSPDSMASEEFRWTFRGDPDITHVDRIGHGAVSEVHIVCLTVARGSKRYRCET